MPTKHTSHGTPQPDQSTKLFIRIFGGIALLLLLIAGGLVFPATRSYQQAHADLSTYVLATAPLLEDSPPGRKVMVEGVIAPATPPIHGKFVAYWAGHETGPSDETYTVVTETAAPNLVIVTPQGQIQVRGPYEIASPPRTLPGAGIDSYHGFMAGDPVFVLGTATGSGDGAGINARVVSGASRGSYMFGAQFSSILAFLPVAICAFVGAIFGSIALAFWRFM